MLRDARSNQPRERRSPSGPAKPSSRHRSAMLALADWCVAHRRRVVLAWVAFAVAASVLAGSIGRHYATNFSLPGTESQRASDLLSHEFAAQSGDTDTIVFRVSHGTIDAPAVREAITPLLARVSGLRHVASVVSPYSRRGAVQVSHDRMTAFATINYDKPANLLPTVRQAAAGSDQGHTRPRSDGGRGRSGG